MKKLALSLAALALLAIAPARADDGLKAAIITVAAATFVEESCPGLKPDYAMLAARMKDLGVTEDDVGTPARLRQVSLYLTMFRSQGKAACKMLRDQFGPNGTNLPGLFDVK